MDTTSNGHIDRWKWVERALFLLGIILLVHPVLSTRYYYNLDGPAHVYNASLIRDLLIDGADSGAFWEFNPLPVPNWLGHALFAVLLTFLDPPEAMKVVLLIILVGMPMAVRALVLQRGAAIPWTAHLIFPFVIMSPFVMGFLNFSLGVVLMFLVMWWWERLWTKDSTWGRIALGLLLVALYFSHLMPFLFTAMWMCMRVVGEAIGDPRTEKRLSPALIRMVLRTAASALPAVVFLGWFHFASGPESTPAPPITDRLEQLWRPFVILVMNEEFDLWIAAWCTVFFALIAAVIFRNAAFRTLFRGTRSLSDAAFVALGIVLLWSLPDTFGIATEVLLRMAILVEVSAIVVIPVLQRKWWIGATYSIAALVILSLQLQVRAPIQKERTDRLRAATELTKDLPVGSTVAVISFDWIWPHLAEYGLTQRKAINYSNYEITHVYFPLQRKGPNPLFDPTRAPRPLDGLAGYSLVPPDTLLALDHIIILGPTWNDEQRELMELLDATVAGTHVVSARNDHDRILSRRPN